MGTADYTFPQGAEEPHLRHHTVEAPEPQPFLKSLQYSVKETLFPDDPFRQFKNQNASRKVVLGLQYVFPISEWAPRYNLTLFKSDLIAGITIASLAIPQGISYAKLANLPPILGLCKLDFLSHATIVGFMGGAATVVSLQQLKGIFGLTHFTEATDIISVMRSVFSQTHQVTLGILESYG
ncbi:hypothetical protein YC2023_031215 [Brassica napus]